MKETSCGSSQVPGWDPQCGSPSSTTGRRPASPVLGYCHGSKPCCRLLPIVLLGLQYCKSGQLGCSVPLLWPENLSPNSTAECSQTPQLVPAAAIKHLECWSSFFWAPNQQEQVLVGSSIEGGRPWAQYGPQTSPMPLSCPKEPDKFDTPGLS